MWTVNRIYHCPEQACPVTIDQFCRDEGCLCTATDHLSWALEFQNACLVLDLPADTIGGKDLFVVFQWPTGFMQAAGSRCESITQR